MSNFKAIMPEDIWYISEQLQQNIIYGPRPDQIIYKNKFHGNHCLNQNIVIKLHTKNQSFCVLIYFLFCVSTKNKKCSNNGIMVEFLLWYMHMAIDRDSPSHWIFFGVCNSYTPLPPKAIATLGIPIYYWTSSYTAFCIILLACQSKISTEIQMHSYIPFTTINQQFKKKKNLLCSHDPPCTS